MNELFLTAAYGAKYDTSADIAKAWEEGKDFKVVRGPYCSIRDQEALKSDYNAVYIVQSGIKLRVV